MTYKVIESFADLQDNNHEYRAGDVFPRSDLKVSSNRIKELSTAQNLRNRPLIKEVVEEKKPEQVKKAVKKANDNAK
jgi:hypothetical protein